MPGNPLTDPTWASNVADSIERVVGAVRDKTTAKVITVVRALVFGVIILCGALAALTLAIIIGVKLLEGLVRFPTRTDHDSSVWIAYLVMSGLLFLAGSYCMRKRFSTPNSDPS
jgi:H+/Cl- antiporter ClcA